MADEESLVERELLTGAMFHRGVDYYRGDKIELAEVHATELEELDPPAVGEVGTLAKIAEEQAKAEADIAERNEERARLDAEDLRARQTREQDRLAGDQPASKSGDKSARADRGSIESGDSLRVEKIDEGSRASRRGK